jgi:hypothetical protein
MRRLCPSSFGAVAIILGICLGELAATSVSNAAELNEAVSLVPAKYRHRLVQQLSLAEQKQDQWLDAIVKAKAEQREGVAFLLANMPERDLKGLSSDFLLKNVDAAYGARAASPWAAAVPDEIFLNDVLPYSNLNERRDDWRGDFVARFGPQVKDCKSPGEAAQLLNRVLFKQVDVKYHASKRPKPDQSPYESIEAKFASCSGLAILLVDACRAVGVPARVVGTPRWADNSGNHTWVEVWDGRQWHFVGAAEPGAFDKTWFGDLAAKADNKPEHRIYAASFEHTETPFPLVWNIRNKDHPSVDVTAFYVARRKLKVTVTDADGKPVPDAMVKVKSNSLLVGQAPASEAEFELAADTTYVARATASDGRTATAELKLTRGENGATVAVKLPVAAPAAASAAK